MNDVELSETLDASLTKYDKLDELNFEEAINIIYEPLAIFRVRPVTRCAETMPGHTDAVLHVSYSPDGERLASGGGDLTVRFWNVSTSMPMHTCKGHKNHVLCTSWSPDGFLFVSGDRSGEIRLWNPLTGEQVGRELKAHTKHITSLSFEPFHLNPHCDRLASSSKDRSVIIWNLAAGKVEATLYGHSDSVECVKWGGNSLIYTCSRDRTIKVWGYDESRTYKLVRTLTGHAHRINNLALSTDHVMRTGSFRLGFKACRYERDSSEQEEAVTIAWAKYEAVAGSEGERLVSCSDDFTIFLWRPQHGKEFVARMTGRLY